MKQATLAEFQADPLKYIEEAQEGELLISDDHGVVARLVGMRYKDDEDLAYERSPEFWEMIRERRSQPGIPLEDVIAKFIAEDPDFERLLEEASRMTPEELDAALTSDEEPGPHPDEA